MLHNFAPAIKGFPLERAHGHPFRMLPLPVSRLIPTARQGISIPGKICPSPGNGVQEASRAEGQLIRLALTSRDCAALMPDGGPDAQARIRSLEAELRSMEGELAEADAQHRLYSLLEERTRQAFVPPRSHGWIPRDIPSHAAAPGQAPTHHWPDGCA